MIINLFFLPSQRLAELAQSRALQLLKFKNTLINLMCSPFTFYVHVESQELPSCRASLAVQIHYTST